MKTIPLPVLPADQPPPPASHQARRTRDDRGFADALRAADAVGRDRPREAHGDDRRDRSVQHADRGATRADRNRVERDDDSTPRAHHADRRRTDRSDESRPAKTDSAEAAVAPQPTTDVTSDSAAPAAGLDTPFVAEAAAVPSEIDSTDVPPASPTDAAAPAAGDTDTAAATVAAAATDIADAVIGNVTDDGDAAAPAATQTAAPTGDEPKAATPAIPAVPATPAAKQDAAPAAPQAEVTETDANDHPAEHRAIPAMPATPAVPAMPARPGLAAADTAPAADPATADAAVADSGGAATDVIAAAGESGTGDGDGDAAGHDGAERQPAGGPAQARGASADAPARPEAPQTGQPVEPLAGERSTTHQPPATHGTPSTHPAGFAQELRAQGQVQSFAPTAATETANRAPLPAADQLAVEIGRAVKEGRDRFTLELRPGELGRIAVDLQLDDDHRIMAVIRVERPETLQLLQRDSHALERALQDAGLRTDSGSLSFNLQGEGSRNHPFADQSDDRRSIAINLPAAAAEAAAQLARPWRLGDTGVDISV